MLILDLMFVSPELQLVRRGGNSGQRYFLILVLQGNLGISCNSIGTQAN
jgi:hypothetical protein